MEMIASKYHMLFKAVSRHSSVHRQHFSKTCNTFRRGSQRSRLTAATPVENPMSQAQIEQAKHDYIYEKVTLDYSNADTWRDESPLKFDNPTLDSDVKKPILRDNNSLQRGVEWNGEKVENLLRNSRSVDTQDVNFEFPSDITDHQNEIQKEMESKNRVKQDPKETSILLFPGQGSQFVGMGKKLLQYPNVIDMYKRANHILGYDLLKLCLEGPKSELDKTIYCQPAVLVTSLAAVEKLKHENPQAVEKCIATAGFSVGEYAALTFAGAFSFEDAVHLVNVRAKAMQRASEEISGGMLVVYVGANSRLGDALKAAYKYMLERQGIEQPVIKIANYLFTGCKVLAGNSEGLYFIEKVHREFGIKRVKHLPVSGAFHSDLMGSAKPDLQDALYNLDFQPLAISVFSNVTGKKFNLYTTKRMLVKQLTNQVLWEQTIHAMYARKEGQDYPHTYEVGPGSQLRAMLRLTNGKAYKSSRAVEV